jgi:F420-dependent oxidoreductase-like protein
MNPHDGVGHARQQEQTIQMKTGIQVSRFNYPGGTEAIGPTFADIARRSDAAGFSSLWVMDHFFQIEMVGPAEDPMLEGYSALSFAAGVTENLKLGTLVTGVTYRFPGLLAKTVTTLDVLSGGRAYLGIGAAWYDREHAGLGVPYPPVAERFERLEETLRIVRQMWSDDDGPYDGKHYRLAETLSHPQPISQPHPPILIGGSGEKKTLRLVAQYADACNLFTTPELAHKLDVLRGHCDDLGRDYAEIEKTTIAVAAVTESGSGQTQTPDQFLETMKQQADLGIDHMILSVPNMTDPGILELFGERIIPAAAELKVAGR